MRRYSDCSGGSISMNPPRVRPAVRDGDALVAVALAGGIVVVREEVGALRDRAQHLVAGDHPEPVVLVLQATGHWFRSSCAFAGYVRGTRASAGRTRRRPVRPLPSEPPGARWPVRAHAMGPSRERTTDAAPHAVLASAQTDGVSDPLLDLAPPLDEIALGDPLFAATTSTPRSPACAPSRPIHRTQDLGEPAGPDFWSITPLRRRAIAVSRRSHDVHQRAELRHRGLPAFRRQHLPPRSPRAHARCASSSTRGSRRAWSSA